jgi:vesicle coat complex subunit
MNYNIIQGILLCDIIKRSSHKEVVSMAIKVLGDLALKNKKFLTRCTKILMNLFKIKHNP